MIAEAACFKPSSAGSPAACRSRLVRGRSRDRRAPASARDGQLVERIEEALESAARRLAPVRRKVARLSSEARGEWARDLDRLAALHDTLKPKLVELKEQGERAGRIVREQAEKIRDEIAEVLQRLEAKAKH
jgi:hypothetical protein